MPDMIEHTSAIVAAFVSHNAVPASELPNLTSARQVQRSRVDLDVIVGSFSAPRDIARRSRNQPGAIIASAQSHMIAVDGLSVKMRPDVFRFLLALLALRGGLLSSEDAEVLLWGDRSDGGPDSSINVLGQIIMSARAAAAAVGYQIDNRHGIGWCARRCISDSLQAAE